MLTSKSRGRGETMTRRLSGGLDAPHRLTPISEAVPEPKPLPMHVQTAARDVMTGPLVNSRLGNIVTAYLRQQHRAACLAAAQPVSVVPPVSLLKPYFLPVASRPQQAPFNVALRRERQEIWGGFGGTGTANGELRLHDAYSGEHVELVDAHTAPVNLLQASSWPGSGTAGDQLLLSSSRSEVLLWRADGFDAGPYHQWPGLTRARFNPSATQVIASSRPANVLFGFDAKIRHLPPCGFPGASCNLLQWSTVGELVLWGATLWDPRVPALLHTFDQLSAAGGTGGCFHPGGSEIVLNSEVWDLRNRKLLRSVPLLDGTSITFNSSGDVLCAWLRRPADDSMAALLQPKRRRHPLATSFTSLDAYSYTEIGNVQVERAVLDLCLDPSDSYLAAVAVDIGAGLEGSVSSSVRLYEVGRQRPDEDDEDSDAEADESEDEDEEGDEAILGTAEDGVDDDVLEGSDGDEAGGDDSEANELDLEDGMTLEDALADMYEE
eukprot:gene10781-10937_t